MDLNDTLNWPSGGNNQSNQGGQWPGQPTNPNPVWSGAGGNQPQPVWPGGNPPQPAWPGGNPPQPAWPGGNPPQPAWPGGNPSQPAWSPSGPQPSAPGPGPALVPSRNMAVPYNQDLPRGVYDKLLITIRGTVKPNADKFMVDLHTSSGDLAFHFNPRFNESGKQVIVRNSYIDKKWGREERELRSFPFVKGQPFEIKIMCTNTAFKVAVNNSHLLDYNHRIRNLGSITRFCIINDVTLSNVSIETMH